MEGDRWGMEFENFWGCIPTETLKVNRRPDALIFDPKGKVPSEYTIKLHDEDIPL